VTFEVTDPTPAVERSSVTAWSTALETTPGGCGLRSEQPDAVRARMAMRVAAAMGRERLAVVRRLSVITAP
jgi:hypothetical protein